MEKSVESLSCSLGNSRHLMQFHCSCPAALWGPSSATTSRAGEDTLWGFHPLHAVCSTTYIGVEQQARNHFSEDNSASTQEARFQTVPNT